MLSQRAVTNKSWSRVGLRELSALSEADLIRGAPAPRPSCGRGSLQRPALPHICAPALLLGDAWSPALVLGMGWMPT